MWMAVGCTLTYDFDPEALLTHSGTITFAKKSKFGSQIAS